MITGETVTVELREVDGLDDYGEVTYRKEILQVDNVLVAPGGAVDQVSNASPEGVKIIYTLYFPKSYKGKSLRGATVVVRGERFRVVGDPKPYPLANTPTLWDMPVQVEAFDAE